MTKGTKIAFFGPVSLIVVSAVITFVGSFADIKSLKTFALRLGVLGFLLLPIGITVGIVLAIIKKK